MKITLSLSEASRPNTIPPKISVKGLLVTIDGTVIDLSAIPPGGEADATEDSLLFGKVTRDAITIRYRYSTDIYSPNQSTDINDFIFDITDGTLTCPLIKRG